MNLYRVVFQVRTGPCDPGANIVHVAAVIGASITAAESRIQMIYPRSTVTIVDAELSPDGMVFCK